jgi:hypothetical protein
MSSRIRVFLCLSPCLLVLATGCSLGNFHAATSTPTNPASTTMNIAGKVHGGQQPVSGATIQLYEANTTTNQGASTAMLTTTVTTAGDGSFSITGDYTCPVSNPFVYIVATGGNPGLGGSVNNTDISMMALLGTCSTLTSASYVVINELSTVASAQALSSFMKDAADVGSAPSDLLGIASAFANAADLGGEFSGSAAAVDLPDLTLNTLADILAACVNTAGGTSGDGSPCGKLLSLSGGTDTATAALKMAQSPGNNPAQLYALITASAPFQPYFSSVPSDFTNVVGFAAPADARLAALDSNGHIWIYTGGYSYNTVTDMSTDTEGVITVYDNNFNQLFTVSPGTGGLYYPTSLTSDKSGNVYSVNANNTISKFNSSGGAVSPSGGWSTGITSSFTGTGSGNSYQDDPSEVGPITVDAQGNIWAVIPSPTFPPPANSPCYAELNSSGSIITPASISAFCASMGETIGPYVLTDLDSFAPDGSGNAWALSGETIGKVNASGALAATAPTSQSCFEPVNDLTGNNYQDATTTIGYDHVNNQLWGGSQTGVGAITDSGTALFCDTPSASMPFIEPYATSASASAGTPYSAGSVLLTSAVLDGAGNLWFTLGGIAATGTVGQTSGTFNGTATYSTWLAELSPSGALLTPLNTATPTYGLQPTGMGANVTVTATEATLVNDSETVALFGVDNSGNIWALDGDTDRVFKISGLATANTVNY